MRRKHRNTENLSLISALTQPTQSNHHVLSHLFLNSLYIWAAIRALHLRITKVVLSHLFLNSLYIWAAIRALHLRITKVVLSHLFLNSLYIWAAIRALHLRITMVVLSHLCWNSLYIWAAIRALHLRIIKFVTAGRPGCHIVHMLSYCARLLTTILSSHFIHQMYNNVINSSNIENPSQVSQRLQSPR